MAKKTFLNDSKGFGSLLGDEETNNQPSSPVEQLSLPYEQITKIANRDYLRANFEKAFERVAYYIPRDKIEIRGGFNRQIFKDIELLADLIEAHDLIEPLVVDVLADGRIQIEKGERRYRAIDLLVKRGCKKDFSVLPCYVNGPSVTELQRATDIWVSNMGRQDLHPLDQAQMAVRLKTMFGKSLSNEEIGKQLGTSRQTVDNLILIYNSDDATKDEIKNGAWGITEAVRYIRAEIKAKKDAEKKENASHQTSLAINTPKDPLKDELAELDELDQQAKAITLEAENGAENGSTTEKPEKELKYDESRPEIAQIQEIIKSADKLEMMVNRLDVPDGVKTDVAGVVYWIQKQAAELRPWIHTNKKR